MMQSMNGIIYRYNFVIIGKFNDEKNSNLMVLDNYTRMSIIIVIIMCELCTNVVIRVWVTCYSCLGYLLFVFGLLVNRVSVTCYSCLGYLLIVFGLLV